MRTPGNRARALGLLGVAAGFMLLLSAAGPAEGGGRYRDRGVHYVVVRRPQAVVVRPVRADHFIVRRPRFVVVRPVPYWPVAYGNAVDARLGVNVGGLHLGVSFRRVEPYYGCNFCDAYFDGYGAWEAHVAGCADQRVICEPWDDGDVDAFRAAAWQEWERHDARGCHR
jgi:hypothetical protein